MIQNACYGLSKMAVSIQTCQHQQLTNNRPDPMNQKAYYGLSKMAMSIHTCQHQQLSNNMLDPMGVCN
jgi:hypothetical protein